MSGCTMRLVLMLRIVTCACQQEHKLPASTKQDPAFISQGYTDWKDAKAAFNKHTDSACHEEAVQVACFCKQQATWLNDRVQTTGLRMKSVEHCSEIFCRTFVSLLTKDQGLALQGHVDGVDSNLLSCYAWEHSTALLF